MIIENLNNAEYLLVKAEKICEFLIDKKDYKIIQIKNQTEETSIDVTNQCLHSGCKYIIDSQGNICIQYKLCNILAKILNGEVDIDCIEFLAKAKFDVALY